jgi:hypothetical protein
MTQQARTTYHLHQKLHLTRTSTNRWFPTMAIQRLIRSTRLVAMCQYTLEVASPPEARLAERIVLPFVAVYLLVDGNVIYPSSPSAFWVMTMLLSVRWSGRAKLGVSGGSGLEVMDRCLGVVGRGGGSGAFGQVVVRGLNEDNSGSWS